MFKMLSLRNKKGSMDKLLDIVIVLILVGALAPVALITLFNSSAFTGVPAWVVTILGTVGAVAFIYLIVRVAKGGKH